jgi:hypothetical protein
MNLCTLLNRDKERIVLISGSGDVIDYLDRDEAVELATRLLDYAGQLPREEE